MVTMQRDTPPLAIELALYNKAASCYLPFFFFKKKKLYLSLYKVLLSLYQQSLTKMSLEFQRIERSRFLKFVQFPLFHYSVNSFASLY